jgi:hypothetical protein
MNKKLVASYVLAGLALLPTIASAVGLDVGTIACKVEGLVWIAFGVAAVVYFLWYGILFLMAAGDPGKVATARQGLLWGVVGVVVGGIALSIVSVISTYFEISTSVFHC